MPVCKFFLNGNCKYGDQCKYDHVIGNGGGGNGGPRDPFAQSGPQGGHAKRQTGRGGKRPSSTKDTPVWPMTVIGAHPLSMGNVVTGDVSPEELRAQAYLAAPQSRGCSDEVVQREQGFVSDFQQRNNITPGQQTQGHTTAAPVDPFASSGGGGRQQQQQASRHQQPIFGAAQPAAQAQIFPVAAQQPMAQQAGGFAHSGMDGFSAGQPQNAFQQQAGAMAPNVHGAQQSFASAPPVGNEQAYAFKRVPENPPII